MLMPLSLWSPMRIFLLLRRRYRGALTRFLMRPIVRDARRRPAPAYSCSHHARQNAGPPPCRHRSEEHTSELQSPMRISYAVFCLKKKTTQQVHIPNDETRKHCDYANIINTTILTNISLSRTLIQH